MPTPGPGELLALLAIGLCAGVLGGLLGLGGSVIIIPMLTLVMGRDQHLAQAAAMIVNVFIAVPSFYQHRRAGVVREEVAFRLIPFGLVFVILGVEVSNRVNGPMLQKVFGAFLLYLVVLRALRLFRDRRRDARPPAPRTGWPYVGLVGGITGFAAGLLGIGGGPISVPLLQRLCRLPLRLSIGGSTALMSLTALVGAFTKNASLARLTDASGHPLGLHVHDSVVLAALLAPTALLGALLGAKLTHNLPLGWVRVAFLLLLAWASALMLGIA